MQFVPAPSPPSDVMEIDRLAQSWYVARTQPNHENKLAADLERMGIMHFLPLATRRSFARGKWHWVEVPLFATYVAFAGTVEDRWEVVASRPRRAHQILEVLNRPHFVSQLHAVQLALAENPKLSLFHGSPVGKMCRVIGGSLRGKEGRCDRISQSSGRIRLILRVDMFGDSIETEVDAENIELL